MSRVRDIANILSGGSSAIATDAEITSATAYIPGNVAGKNAIINGGFDIWQRGTTGTFAGAVTYPSVDRWFGVCTGTAPTATISQTTADTTGLRYAMRFGRNSGQTNTGQVWVETAIETANAISLAGKTVTYSFYVKAGANAALSLQALMYYGTGSDQSAATAFNTGWTNGGYVAAPTFAVTTTMTRYSFTATVPSNATELLVGFTYLPTGTAGANEWYQIEGVQLELGSVATPFSRAGGTYQGELALCQRYYQRYKADSVFDDLGYSGKAVNTTEIYASRMPFVPFRVGPTSIDFANVTWIPSWGAGTTGISNITFASYSSADTPLLIFTTTNVSTGSFYIILAGNTSNAYIGLSAEL